MDYWTRIYLWEIDFADGRSLQQANIEDRNRMRLTKEYGQATCIRLTPQRPGLVTVSVAVPQGCRPVYCRRTPQPGLPQRRPLQFFIGWCQDVEKPGAMQGLEVDSITGNVTQIAPESYNGQ
jgi:hypothetical protein